MKILIASDIHGSYYYAEKIYKIYNTEKPDKMIILGDVYYHGPRNPLPKDYNPMKVCELLNKIHEELKENFIVIKGNCDAEVDEMISNFKFHDEKIVEINGKKMLCTHGHKHNIDNIPNVNFDIMAYGHFHVNFIKEKNGKKFINPGSISLPKNDTRNGYIIINDDEIKMLEVN